MSRFQTLLTSWVSENYVHCLSLMWITIPEMGFIWPYVWSVLNHLNNEALLLLFREVNFT